MLLSEIVNLAEMARPGSKLDACEQIYNQYKDTLSRKEMIDMFVNQAGCTPLGASTFYSNIKKSASVSTTSPTTTQKLSPRSSNVSPTQSSVSRELTPTQKIEKWLLWHKIENYSINDDGTIDVNGNVMLGEHAVDHKLAVRFGTVTGNFYVGASNLNTLEGCPRFVGGVFNCSHNNLTSLLHGPIQVGGSYRCQDNELTSLEGAPINIEGGDFNCSNNPKLTSLDNAPGVIGGDLNAWSTGISSLHNIHKIVKHIGGSLKVSNISKSVVITHILGILLIDGIDTFIVGTDNDSRVVKDIMRKYMFDEVTKQPIPKNKRDIITCQDELIDAGYSKFAKL